MRISQLESGETSRRIDPLAWDKGWHIGDLAIGYHCPGQEMANSEAIRMALHEQIHDLGDTTVEPFTTSPDFWEAAQVSLSTGLREQQRRSVTRVSLPPSVFSF